MVALGATNWLNVAGLIFALLGALTLAGAINMGTRADPQDLARYHRAGGHQRAGTAYAGLLLSIGTGLLLLGQFYFMAMGPTIVMMLLGVVPLLLVYLYFWDQAGEQSALRYQSGADETTGGTLAMPVAAAAAVEAVSAAVEPKLKVAV